MTTTLPMPAAEHLYAHDLAFDLLEGALDIMRGRADALPQIDAVLADDPALVTGTLDQLLTVLAAIVTTHEERDCAGLRPPAVIRTLSTVLCGCCLNKRDVKTALRNAHRHTAFVAEQMHRDPGHWLVVLTYTAAACLTHAADPVGMLEALDDALPAGPSPANGVGNR